MSTVKPQHHYYFILSFLLISINLRMSFAAAEPLMGAIMRDLGLNMESSSFFALLPVMILGVAAPIGSRMTGIIRPRVLIIYALILALGGIIYRSYGGVTGLFLGTGLIGLGLGITGTVILGIIKQVYPKQNAQMLGAYSAFISVGTAISGGVSAPIALALGGWREGLLFWALPLILAIIIWTELTIKEPDAKEHHPVQASMRPLLRAPKAWMISLFYISRVSSAWLIIVWVATLMRQRGLPLEEAGIVLALTTGFMIPSSLLYEYSEQKLGGRRISLIFFLLLSSAGNALLLLGPLQLWPLFAGMLGIGLGALFTLAMNLIVSNSADSKTTFALSGMAQGMGFLLGGALAWLFSLVMGYPHQHVSVSILYGLCSIAALIFGWKSTTKELIDLNALEDTLEEQKEN